MKKQSPLPDFRTDFSKKRPSLVGGGMPGDAVTQGLVMWGSEYKGVWWLRFWVGGMVSHQLRLLGCTAKTTAWSLVAQLWRGGAQCLQELLGSSAASPDPVIRG